MMKMMVDGGGNDDTVWTELKKKSVCVHLRKAWWYFKEYEDSI